MNRGEESGISVKRDEGRERALRRDVGKEEKERGNLSVRPLLRSSLLLPLLLQQQQLLLLLLPLPLPLLPRPGLLCRLPQCCLNT